LPREIVSRVAACGPFLCTDLGLQFVHASKPIDYRLRPPTSRLPTGPPSTHPRPLLGRWAPQGRLWSKTGGPVEDLGFTHETPAGELAVAPSTKMTRRGDGAGGRCKRQRLLGRREHKNCRSWIRPLPWSQGIAGRYPTFFPLPSPPSSSRRLCRHHGARRAELSRLSVPGDPARRDVHPGTRNQTEAFGGVVCFLDSAAHAVVRVDLCFLPA
jgi:hypothetical protein